MHPEARVLIVLIEPVAGCGLCLWQGLEPGETLCRGFTPTLKFSERARGSVREQYAKMINQ